MILTDTDHLWGHGGEVGWIWKSFTRGMNVLFMDPWEPIPADMPGWVRGGVSLNQRYYHVWDPLRRSLGYTRRFALRMNMSACVPHGELCTSTYCLADPGQEYLCFFPSGGSEGLDLWEAPVPAGTVRGPQFAVEWFNPATGETVNGREIAGGRRHALSAPFPGAAVLYLRKTEP